MKKPRRPNPAALGADSPTSSRVVHSARILGDACEKFQNYCIDGIELDFEQINQYVDRSLMLVTALFTGHRLRQGIVDCPRRRAQRTHSAGGRPGLRGDRRRRIRPNRQPCNTVGPF
jgi:hypothetical protein